MEKPKDQLADRIKNANNVLITVSTNPSVDQLAAAIGLTLVLNKLKKHATTVFSGEVPSTIEFLSPDETIETNTDSLRDFIISLDKAKADKIRYKVEDTMVKIFITPYKTSITDQDLVFGQGDFNVDVVVALGVQARDDLDQAITTHGRILHDATVATVNVTETSEMGAINWIDKKASSLCEMIVGLISDLKEDALDEQMATAFLTGIVAETDRFSNERTTSDTMSASAILMAAGANQQLVATKLDILTDKPESEDLSEDDDENDGDSESREVSVDNDGALRIHHENDKPPEKRAKDKTGETNDIPELPEPQLPDSEAPPSPPEPQPVGATSQEPLQVSAQLPPQQPPSQGFDTAPQQPQLRVGSRRAFDAPAPEPLQAGTPQKETEAVPSRVVATPPTTGGALNATTDQKSGDEPVLNPVPQQQPILNRGTPFTEVTASEPATPSVPPQPSMPLPAKPVVAPITMVQPPRPHVDKTTLKDIEAAVDSHHRSEPAKAMEGKTLEAIEEAVSTATSTPQPPLPSNDPVTSDENAIRARIDEALKNSVDANAPAMEPIAALGAGGRMEISHDSGTANSAETQVDMDEMPEDGEVPKDILIDTDGTFRYPKAQKTEDQATSKTDVNVAENNPLAPPPVPPPMTMPSPNNTP